MTEPGQNKDLFASARDEISGMAKQGMAHTSTKPVLTGAGIGAVAALVLPFVSIPLGLIAGAGFMLYKRVRR